MSFSYLTTAQVVDGTLVNWILPYFTTTTWHDRTIGSIAMMSTLSLHLPGHLGISYFDFRRRISCGIPSVTLDGEKSDWEEIYRRVNRLYEFGAEPSAWADMLRPIIRRFIGAFEGDPDVPFWEQVMHKTGVSCGIPAVNGWITAFCVWSHEGGWTLWGKPDSLLPRGTNAWPSFERVRQLRQLSAAEKQERKVTKHISELFVLRNSMDESR